MEAWKDEGIQFFSLPGEFAEIEVTLEMLSQL